MKSNHSSLGERIFILGKKLVGSNLLVYYSFNITKFVYTYIVSSVSFLSSRQSVLKDYKTTQIEVQEKSVVKICFFFLWLVQRIFVNIYYSFLTNECDSCKCNSGLNKTDENIPNIKNNLEWVSNHLIQNL